MARSHGSGPAGSGALLAVHWRHPVPEYPRSGDDVHQVLAREPGLSRLAEHRESDFVAEVCRRGPPVSVAQATGSFESGEQAWAVRGARKT